MTDDIILAATGQLVPPKTSCRSKEQNEALNFVLGDTYDGIIVLPTEGGKV